MSQFPKKANREVFHLNRVNELQNWEFCVRFEPDPAAAALNSTTTPVTIVYKRCVSTELA
jgi:hypothetical protein